MPRRLTGAAGASKLPDMLGADYSIETGRVAADRHKVLGKDVIAMDMVNYQRALVRPAERLASGTRTGANRTG